MHAISNLIVIIIKRDLYDIYLVIIIIIYWDVTYAFAQKYSTIVMIRWCYIGEQAHHPDFYTEYYEWAT